MADSEFEQLIYLPQTKFHPKNAVDPYTLVHDLDDDTSPSPEDPEPEVPAPQLPSPSSCFSSPSRRPKVKGHSLDETKKETTVRWDQSRNEHRPCSPLAGDGAVAGCIDGTRRRRRLPEIPKFKKASRTLSLADELGAALTTAPDFMIGGVIRPLALRKSLRYDDSSPDSERLISTDADSGNSTAHSPDLLKSGSPIQDPGSFTPISGSSSSDRMGQLEIVDPTHRGLHRFVPRHRDEVEIDIGDPIYVKREDDDLWCEGVNLRTGKQGIFPSAHIVDVDYSDFDPSQHKVRRERFILGYLGSVETLAHKGNSVLCQAVKKIRSKDYTPHSCILEISDTGIRMVDRKKPIRKEVGCHDYFYSLKNVSFCAFHPRDQRYMGFITKHPSCDRFACHVYVGCESTRPVAEAVGRAFNRFYQKYVETAFPVEDIYIE